MTTESRDALNLEDLFHNEIVDYSVLRNITNNFSNDWKIGGGGFGVVYKDGESNTLDTTLRNNVLIRGGFIAVKELISVLDDTEFRGEVDCLRSIKHSNVVRYLGYCAEEQQQRGVHDGKEIWARHRHQLICFEYLRNGSLDKHLTGEPCGLEWPVCYKIIQGICQGLQYLHEQGIIHRDIKPQNILLDNDMSPKITDFGLSRLLADGKSRIITKQMGTLGYIAPESASSGEFTPKSDIYSLGVVIRQIVRARMTASEEDPMLEWSRRLNQLDASKKHAALEQVRACIEISLQCTSHEVAKRPTSIQHIVHRLHTPTDWSVASDMNTSLAPPARSPEVLLLPGPSLPTSPRGLGDTSPDKVLSARSLRITWGDTPDYWSWNSRHGSRFGECAELLKVYFLAVIGEITQKDLSAGASYEVFLVYKLAPGATGLRGGAVLTSSLRLYGQRIVATSKVSLDPAEAQRVRGVTYPVARSNGWLEIRLAKFDNDGGMLGEKAVIVDLREENDTIMKSGLIIECMEFRIRHI